MRCQLNDWLIDGVGVRSAIFCKILPGIESVTPHNSRVLSSDASDGGLNKILCKIKQMFT